MRSTFRLTHCNRTPWTRFSTLVRSGLFLVPAVLFGFASEVSAQVSSQLQIVPISNTSIELGDTLSVTVLVTNSVAPGNLQWSIGSGPAGISIVNSSPDSAALLTWQPTASQAPSTN